MFNTSLLPSFTPLTAKVSVLTVWSGVGVMATPENSASVPLVLLAVVLPLPATVPAAENVNANVAGGSVVVPSFTVKAKLSAELSAPPWRYLIRPAAMSAWVKVLLAVRASPASTAPLPLRSLNSVPLVGAVPTVYTSAAGKVSLSVVASLAAVRVVKPPLAKLAPVLVAATGALSLAVRVTVLAKLRAVVSLPPLLVPPLSLTEVSVTVRLVVVGAVLVFW